MIMRSEKLDMSESQSVEEKIYTIRGKQEFGRQYIPAESPDSCNWILRSMIS